MKVLYSFPHPLGGPGIGTVAWHHVDALARAGADVTVVTTRVARRFDDDLQVRAMSVLGPVRPRMLGVSRARDIVDRVTARLVRTTRPDVVHLWPGAVHRSAAAGDRFGITTLREAPSPYTRVAARQAAEAWRQLDLEIPAGHFHRLSETALVAEDAEFRAVDLVVAGSPEAAATFAEAPFPLQVAVSRYGFDPAQFYEIPREGNAPTVLFLGRGEPTKGIHVLLEAWRRAVRPAGSRLLIAGPMNTLVRSLVAENLNQPGIVECGWVADIAALVRRVDMLALPSFSEGSALVSYEALGAGVVPLVSRAVGSPVVPGVDGLIHETGDTEELVHHLETVLSDSGDRQRLRDNGRISRDLWTWRACGDRLLTLYADAVNGGVAKTAARHEAYREPQS